jgi:hypothetical protein
MVIETTRPHSGWKYGNVDDQYDNDSVGSTKKRLESGKIGTKMNKQNLCATKARTASESKLNGEIGITTMAANGPSECNQISIRVTADINKTQQTIQKTPTRVRIVTLLVVRGACCGGKGICADELFI